jgi:hypothetical protein
MAAVYPGILGPKVPYDLYFGLWLNLRRQLGRLAWAVKDGLAMSRGAITVEDADAVCLSRQEAVKLALSEALAFREAALLPADTS